MKPVVQEQGITALRSNLRLREKGQAMTMDVRKAAQKEYKERMKKRLDGMPLPLEYLLMKNQPIKQEDLDAINNAQIYANREKIPEPLLPYSDLYNELTGQEPTGRTFTDWIDTFWAWKDQKLSLDDIRQAWAQAQSEKGFTVGRPGALTVTAIGMKSKAKPAIPQLNMAEIERTRKMLEEKEGKFVPMPDSVRQKLKGMRGK